MQWPIGIAAFSGIVVAGAASVAFMFAPAIVSFTDQPAEVAWPSLFSYGDGIATFETPLEALQLTPLGILGFVLTTHLILVFSSLHRWWAKLMLGSRSKRISSGPQPAQAGADEPGTVKASTSETATHDPRADVNTGRDASEPKFALDTAAIEQLTKREQQVFMLMAPRRHER